jgi:hypothetical protein
MTLNGPWEMLPIASDGPTNTFRLLPMALIGPSIVLYTVIDCLEWAQTLSREVLSMALNWPSIFVGIAADLLGRVQQYSREVLPITSDGPLGISTDGLEWA